MILVAGGDADPNINALVRRLASRSLPQLALCVGAASHPRLVWDLEADRLSVDGADLRPQAIFLRYDVFTHLEDRRPESQRRASRWYTTLLAWALAHPEVSFLNRRYGSRQSSKPYVLQLARERGLAIPATIVTNDDDVLAGLDGESWITKPVNGGEYTRLLAEALADPDWRRRAGDEPSLLQERLHAPDLRIYRVGKRWFAFTLRSPELDYRTTRQVAIEAVPAPEGLVTPLAGLMDFLGLDFGAADFKTCPTTGRHLFLEVNSAPMFTAFDSAARGAISDAIVDWLLEPTLYAAPAAQVYVARVAMAG